MFASRHASLTSLVCLGDSCPERYATELWEETCEAVYEHVYGAYMGAGRSIYGASQA